MQKQKILLKKKYEVCFNTFGYEETESADFKRISYQNRVMNFNVSYFEETLFYAKKVVKETLKISAD